MTEDDILRKLTKENDILRREMNGLLKAFEVCWRLAKALGARPYHEKSIKEAAVRGRQDTPLQAKELVARCDRVSGGHHGYNEKPELESVSRENSRWSHPEVDGPECPHCNTRWKQELPQ